MRAIYLYVNYRFQQAKLLGVFGSDVSLKKSPTSDTFGIGIGAGEGGRGDGGRGDGATAATADEVAMAEDLARELAGGSAGSSRGDLAPMPDEDDEDAGGFKSCFRALDRITDAWLVRRKKAFTEQTMILALMPAMAVFVTWVVVAQ
ncbi:hypothetical protein HK101_005144, partial [Irineochytrium annulatum]